MSYLDSGETITAVCLFFNGCLRSYDSMDGTMVPDGTNDVTTPLTGGSMSLNDHIGTRLSLRGGGEKRQMERE